MTDQATNQRGDNLLRAFRDILRGEAAGGYADRMVFGGLDGFLATLRAEAASVPAVAALQREGLLAVGYAELPPEKRKQWADEAGRVLDSPLLTPAREPAASPVPPAAKPRPKRPPAPIALDSPIETLKSVTRPSATKLRGMGVQTVPRPRVPVPNAPHRLQRAAAHRRGRRGRGADGARRSLAGERDPAGRETGA